MQYIVINLVAIAAAAIVGLAILFVGFRSRFSVATLAASALGLFWLAAILAGALILAPVSAGAWTVALGSAFIIWIGFVLPALSIALTLRGQPWSTSLLDAAWWLIIMLAQATILHAVGLTAPAISHSVSVERSGEAPISTNRTAAQQLTLKGGHSANWLRRGVKARLFTVTCEFRGTTDVSARLKTALAISPRSHTVTWPTIRCSSPSRRGRVPHHTSSRRSTARPRFRSRLHVGPNRQMPLLESR